MDKLNRRNFIEKSATLAAFSLVAEWASASTASDKWGNNPASTSIDPQW